MKQKAFSLIELLVVISIISIFSALILVNYRVSERNLGLQRSASKLSHDIRRVQEMAMGAKVLDLGVLPGYGIYLNLELEEEEKNYYLLYGDRGGNGRYDEGQDIIIEEIPLLEKEVEIKQILPANPVSINFSPPDPIIKIFAGGNEVNEATIILSLRRDQTQERKIKVNKAGLIYIE